jgi:hypothetical protein
MSNVLFFTLATKFYRNFIPLYIYFAARSNSDASFEILTDSYQDAISKHGKSISWLESYFNITVRIRILDSESQKPAMDNSYRFIVEPIEASEYVYIGDIDILILEDVYQSHSKVFDAGLPYSNVIRKGSKRLTGLHFVRRSAYYPLPCVDDLVATITNDEALLYAICDRKGILYDNSLYYAIKKGRPVHGIHMSLNRLPFSYARERAGWEMTPESLKLFSAITDEPAFREFSHTLYDGSKYVLLNLIYLSAGYESLGANIQERLFSNLL